MTPPHIAVYLDDGSVANVAPLRHAAEQRAEIDRSLASAGDSEEATDDGDT
jgi:hypothetical protein